MQAIRLLTSFGEVGGDPEGQPAVLQKELRKLILIPGSTCNSFWRVWRQIVTAEQNDTPLLMKAAEHMAIRFAMERFQKGEVKVNAVHQMMEHMSRQMDTLRQILRIQEEKMNKAGILVESHADILDRMFWAEVPEAGKKSVLLSNEAPCVPPRNVRQFVEVLLERGDKETAADDSEKLLRAVWMPKTRKRGARLPSASVNSPTCLPRRADNLMGRRSRKVGEASIAKKLTLNCRAC